MHFLTDPWFWALLTAFSLIGAAALIGSAQVGKHRALGLAIVGLFAAGRVILVLPFCLQPRFNGNLWTEIVGWTVFAVGIFFATPAFNIRPFEGPTEAVALRRTGLYGMVRNPLYLSELLWCLGLSIAFDSIIGVALVPVWWIGLSFLTMIEEDRLEQRFGEAYVSYCHKVRGRIIPGLPL